MTFGVLFALGIAVGAKPASAAVTSDQIEAAYLFNFARFVEWPQGAFASRDAPLVIGILGKDPFGGLIDEVVKGENINGRPIVVRRFGRVQEIDTCHVLFIAQSESDHVAQICTALKNRHILTVSEIPDFARRGGMIELVEENARIRFRIDLARARADMLSVSAKLLQLAEIVSGLSHRSRAVASCAPGLPSDALHRSSSMDSVKRRFL